MQPKSASLPPWWDSLTDRQRAMCEYDRLDRPFFVLERRLLVGRRCDEAESSIHQTRTDAIAAGEGWKRIGWTITVTGPHFADCPYTAGLKP